MNLELAAALLALVVACSRSQTNDDPSPSPSRPSVTPSTAPSAGVPPPSGSAPGEARKPFGTFCVEDAECAGGVCFHKRMKGPDAGRERRDAAEAVEHDGYCSLRCDADDDCPVPPTKGKCGARGMCKRPD